MNRFMALFVPVLLLCILCPSQAGVRGNDANDGGNERTKLAGMIAYEQNNIVFVKEDAVLAVSFEEVEPFTVKYRYRLLEKGKDEKRGTGTLFDEPKSDKPSSVLIKAGPFKEQWSYSAPGLGWIYYIPEEIQTYYVGDDKFFEVSLQRFLEL